MKQNTPNDINDERDTERVKYARIIEHKICKTRQWTSHNIVGSEPLMSP